MIFWADQTGMRSDAAQGTGWAPIGQPPVVERTGRRFSVNAMCAMSNQGKLYFTVYDGSFNTQTMIDFCARLIATAGAKVHLIVDGHPTHRTKRLAAWLDERSDRIELHYLPGYSPERNPVEILNADLKREVPKVKVANKTELRATLSARLRALQQQPVLVASCFGKPEVRYAA